MKPASVPDRDYDQLRKHWALVPNDISKFSAIVADCEKVWGRRHGEVYAHYQAREVFFSSQRRKFEYEAICDMLRIHNEYCSKRSGEYSTGAPIEESRSKRRRSEEEEEEGEEEGEGESFTIEETNFLTCAYIVESKDAVLDSSSEVFWFCVAKTFKEMKAAGVPDRDPDQLRKHWGRVQKDVSKFAAIFAICQKMHRAKEAFFGSEGRMFEYEDVWEALCCGSEEASSGSMGSDARESIQEEGERRALRPPKTLNSLGTRRSRKRS